MGVSEQAAEAAKMATWQAGRLTLSDMDTQTTVSGELYRFAEYQADTALELRQNEPVELHIPVHETYTADASDNIETVSLSHDLVNPDAVPNPVVLQNQNTNSEGTIDAVDYANNTVDIDTNGNSETYSIYYMAGDQARVVFRIKAPKNVSHEPEEADAGLANLRDQREDPLTFDHSSPMSGVIPTDWKVQVLVDAPYSTELSNSNIGSQEAYNAMVSLPIIEADREIPGLGADLRAAIGQPGGV